MLGANRQPSALFWQVFFYLGFISVKSAAVYNE
jgi:hypothetical protein